MMGVALVCKIYLLLPLILLASLAHSLPSNFLNFTDSNFPRQFVQQPSAPPPGGQTENPERPSITNRPIFINNNQGGIDTDGNQVFPYPYPQRPTVTTEDSNPIDYDSTSTTTTEYYTSSTTKLSTTDFTTTTTTEENEGSSATTTTVSNNYDSSEEDEDSSSTTITLFIKPDLPGFPINPPTFTVLPTAGGQAPKPSISSTLLSNYPQQHIHGAVGPFPEKLQEQQLVPGGLIGLGAGVGQLLQRLNPLLLLRPVTDTFQNIGHVLSHPNYGPGSAFLRPIQFWSAVNAAGNPSLAPYRKLPANVVVASDNKK